MGASGVLQGVGLRVKGLAFLGCPFVELFCKGLSPWLPKAKKPTSTSGLLRVLHGWLY